MSGPNQSIAQWLANEVMHKKTQLLLYDGSQENWISKE